MRIENIETFCNYIKERPESSISKDWIIWMLDILTTANLINPDWLRATHTIEWHTQKGIIRDTEPPYSL